MTACHKCAGARTITICETLTATCPKCGGLGTVPGLMYAGVGSRVTPLPIVAEMENIAMRLALMGWTLRSGGGKRQVPHVPNTDSADLAFERGCDSMHGKKIIRVATEHAPALEHAARFHPAWDKCDAHAQALHARNSQVIAGDDFETPVRFGLCWTKNGKITGGTGQALRVADAYDVPMFNFATTPVADFWSWFDGKVW